MSIGYSMSVSKHVTIVTARQAFPHFVCRSPYESMLKLSINDDEDDKKRLITTMATNMTDNIKINEDFDLEMDAADSVALAAGCIQAVDIYTGPVDAGRVAAGSFAAGRVHAVPSLRVPSLLLLLLMPMLKTDKSEEEIQQQERFKRFLYRLWSAHYNWDRYSYKRTHERRYN